MTKAIHTKAKTSGKNHSQKITLPDLSTETKQTLYALAQSIKTSLNADEGVRQAVNAFQQDVRLLIGQPRGNMNDFTKPEGFSSPKHAEESLKNILHALEANRIYPPSETASKKGPKSSSHTPKMGPEKTSDTVNYAKQKAIKDFSENGISLRRFSEAAKEIREKLRSMNIDIPTAGAGRGER